jgi:hypothetical protein
MYELFNFPVSVTEGLMSSDLLIERLLSYIRSSVASSYRMYAQEHHVALVLFIRPSTKYFHHLNVNAHLTNGTTPSSSPSSAH